MTRPNHQPRDAAMPTVGGHPGPVLVIADNDAIARRARAWASGFAAEGRLHRVRLAGSTAADIDALVAEASGLGATAILVAGAEAARQAGQSIAIRLGLPLAIETEATAPPDR